jgi:hypothetical protein
MPPCSGQDFAPYALKRLHRWKATPADPILTPIDVQPLVQHAVEIEDHRFESGVDDLEGMGCSSRPISPLTELESDDQLALPDQRPRRFGPSPDHIEKKRRNAAAHARRARKRVKAAASSHGPHDYTANPSTAMHHSEDLPPLHVPVDASRLPASGSGSWIGKRKKGTKKTPWTLPELLDDNFVIVEWDGRCDFF